MASKEQTVKVVSEHGPLGWTLFVAWVGAWIYFYNQDPGFLSFFWSALKAAVWPAFVVYEVLGVLGV